MPLWSWSQTSSANATADPTINFAEGQAPSSLNDSSRALMSAVAKYRDDIAGAVVTSGTSIAYTVASYSIYDTLAHLNGQMIAFTPHITNGATVTLNVDSLGAKPLRSAPNAELLAGTIIQGTPYVAVYNNSDGAFYLNGFYGSPYLIPLGGMIDYVGSSTPNSNFVFPAGQAISRTTYATFFSLVGTTYGSGDGSTTFNVPDLRGRISAAPDNMGGSAAGRLSSYTSLGANGGEQTHPLVDGEIPSITSTGTFTASQSIFVATNSNSFQFSTGGGGTPFQAWQQGANISLNAPTGPVSVTSSGTNGTAHNNVQPTIALNKILRII